MTANKKHVPNRLVHEKSPYLLQHAYNPVNWYPWCDEAFEKAKAEDKPIFLSIGYSTCHWCHVMERESFEDENVARLLNQYYVPIKVDREERPDIDHIYMNVCQALTGHGGWPLTIFMTPDQKPFFAGTYFPRNDRMGMQGLITILETLQDAWQSKRNLLLESSQQILEHISKESESGYAEITEDIFDTAFREFQRHFDATFGGFGHAPKFPTPHNLMFLLRYWKRNKEPQALLMVEKTLDAMYKGGIYDHIGFGFCRYSTDKKWLVPHFEKMLYDNALLAMAYLEAYQATHKEKYGIIARDVLTYVLRDMTSPEGGFYSAEDADSEGEEGKFYLWTPDEVSQVLGEEAGRAFCLNYDINHKGNFEGRSIPNLINNHLPFEALKELQASGEKLFAHREKRIHPFKDDKILTGWNGLMIGAMALAGRVLKDERFTNAAARAVSFIGSHLFNEEGRLLARYRDGEAKNPAFADDYAFLIHGLIELYETTYEPQYLKRALALTDQLMDLFWDIRQGGLYIYGNDSEALITRPKEIYDGATPSGNSVTALNLLRLARLTGNSSLEERAHQLFRAFSYELRRYPIGYSFALMALLFSLSKGQEVVLVSPRREEAEPFMNILHESFRPFTVSLFYRPGDGEMEALAPFLKAYGKEGERTKAYICEGFACQAPVTDKETFEKQLI